MGIGRQLEYIYLNLLSEYVSSKLNVPIQTNSKHKTFTLIALIADLVTDIILARDIGGFMSIMENSWRILEGEMNKLAQFKRETRGKTSKHYRGVSSWVGVLRPAFYKLK